MANFNTNPYGGYGGGTPGGSVGGGFGGGTPGGSVGGPSINDFLTNSAKNDADNLRLQIEIDNKNAQDGRESMLRQYARNKSNRLFDEGLQNAQDGFTQFKNTVNNLGGAAGA